MDNAAAHKSRVSQQIIFAMFQDGRTIQFQAPYSRELNPIEYCFGFLKRRLKIHPQVPNNLIENVKEVCKTLTVEECRSTIDHVFDKSEQKKE